jgi:large subunit ribosomal protein L24
MQKLKVGDTVQVMSGAERTAAKDRRRGKVLFIDRGALRVTVEGVRMVKRHVKKGRDRANPDGGIIEKAGSVALSNVSLVCPKCDQPTRVGIKADGDDKKRFCKKCEAVID